MRAQGLRGIPREKTRKTTTADGAQTPQRAGLVEREFVAAAPNQLWVADLTYVRTHAGWTYVAFVLDVFSRMVVGWQVSTSLRTDLALDALDMGLWLRRRCGQDTSSLIHHSDRGVQYRAIRYTQRLAEAQGVASGGSRGDSYDNAMAEALNSLFKAECIRNPVMRPVGGWKNVSDIEIAVAEYVDWYNHRRLHGEIGFVPPKEFKAAYWDGQQPQHYPENTVLIEAGTNQNSLYETRGDSTRRAIATLLHIRNIEDLPTCGIHRQLSLTPLPFARPRCAGWLKRRRHLRRSPRAPRSETEASTTDCGRHRQKARSPSRSPAHRGGAQFSEQIRGRPSPTAQPR